MENTPLQQDQEPVIVPRIPWLQKKEIGYWQAIVQTLLQVVISPRNFFDTLALGSGKSGALSFFLVSSGLLVVVRFLLNALTPQVTKDFMQNVVPLVLMSLLMFALSCVAVFAIAGLVFLLVRLLKGQGSFKGVASVVAFTMPSVEILVFFLAILAFILSKIFLLMKFPDKAFEGLITAMGVSIMGLFVLWCILLVMGVARVCKVRIWKSATAVILTVLLIGLGNTLLIRSLVGGNKSAMPQAQELSLPVAAPAATPASVLPATK